MIAVVKHILEVARTCAWRRFFAVGLVMSAAISVFAVSPYPELEGRAQRFFQHREWASAAAMFDLMLQERPDVPSTYGQAIVTAGVRADSLAQGRLMAKALENRQPFDSVFSRVRQWSFHIGRPDVYVKFMENMRTSYPWMKRTIDYDLLRYYTFNHNGAQMVAYSRTMLEGAPGNRDFMGTLAQGYMLMGEDRQGLDLYRQILDSNPNDYDALLNLGNWYAAAASESASKTAISDKTQVVASPPASQIGGIDKAQAAALAADYLSRAYELRPTPYVARLLKALK